MPCRVRRVHCALPTARRPPGVFAPALAAVQRVVSCSTSHSPRQDEPALPRRVVRARRTCDSRKYTFPTICRLVVPPEQRLRLCTEKRARRALTEMEIVWSLNDRPAAATLQVSDRDHVSAPTSQSCLPVSVQRSARPAFGLMAPFSMNGQIAESVRKAGRLGTVFPRPHPAFAHSSCVTNSPSSPSGAKPATYSPLLQRVSTHPASSAHMAPEPTINAGTPKVSSAPADVDPHHSARNSHSNTPEPTARIIAPCRSPIAHPAAIVAAAQTSPTVHVEALFMGLA